MKILTLIVFILFFLLVWGLIGSSQVSELGNTCDLGINKFGSIFCWKWHKNIIGGIQEDFENLLNN